MNNYDIGRIRPQGIADHPRCMNGANRTPHPGVAKRTPYRGVANRTPHPGVAKRTAYRGVANRARHLGAALFLLVGFITALAGIASGMQAGSAQEPVRFPVQPRVLVDGAFERCEGIAFNGEGDLYVSGNGALWRVSTEGEVTQVAELYSNLGLAPIGDRDILMADFGPTNRFNHGPNTDGIVWRITPEGGKTRVVDGGVGDPNALWVRSDGTFLVSDDATDEIFIADMEGRVSVFTDVVGHPNGIAMSADGSRLYVAQIFKSIRPVRPDGRLWALPLADGLPAGPAELIVDLGDTAANDGIALDELGRIYVASNGAQQIWRVDPETRETVVIAEGMPGVASLAFGKGDFDHHAIYATSTRTGKVWEVRVGIGGASLYR